MPTTALGVCSLYFASFVSAIVAVNLRTENETRPHAPLERALQRGETVPGIPKLDPSDAFANAAVIKMVLQSVGFPGFDDEEECTARARSFFVLLDGRRTAVRMNARQVCQLRKLKQISMHQPGHDLAEMAAFVLGRRIENVVDVSRIVVPPFRFTRDSIRFVDADLGPLLKGEQFIGTYHTHPDHDLDNGVLSTVDLSFIRTGHVDFHGQVDDLQSRSDNVDWLFDIVETSDGDWNVFAHDQDKLEELGEVCHNRPRKCPVDELRLTGSRYYLFTRFYDEI
jgi:proteasome lid subunit RPN8/RPN11